MEVFILQHLPQLAFLMPPSDDFTSPPSRETRPRLDKSGAVRVQLAFGEFTFFRHHLEAHVAGGIEVDHPEVDALITVINAQFNGRPYGYLCVRSQAYAVNPMASRRLVEETSVRAGAFVLTSIRSKLVMEAEKLFYRLPVESFDTLEAAEAFLAGQLSDVLENARN